MADQVYSEPRSGNPPALFVRPDLERFYSFNSFSLSVLSTVKIPSNRYNKAGLYIFPPRPVSGFGSNLEFGAAPNLRPIQARCMFQAYCNCDRILVHLPYRHHNSRPLSLFALCTGFIGDSSITEGLGHALSARAVDKRRRRGKKQRRANRTTRAYTALLNDLPIAFAYTRLTSHSSSRASVLHLIATC
jgi:hypothetical protein